MEAAARAGLIGAGDRRPWLAFGALWAVQAALAAALPLVADEAYYLGWSLDLRAGYLDHPPGVAWWAALGAGRPRLPGLVLMPLAWLALADAARRWGVERWRWVPALVMATPLGLSAGLLVTPDVPLVFAWCWALWGVAAGRVAVVGLAVGAGLWAKSAMVVALPGIWWALGLRRGAWALVLAAAVYAPHVVWSVAHDGLPWTFQAGHRRWGWGPLRGVASLAETIGGQLLVVTPGWCLLAVMAWRAARTPVERTLRALGLPILAAWLAASLLTRVEANWPALGWPATLILVLHRGRDLRRAGALAAVLTLGAAAALPVLDRWAPIGAGPPRDGARLAACLADEAGGAAVVAARYQEKALLDAAGVAVGYRRAVGRRASEYDRSDAGGDAGPGCGFVYLADPAALGGRCAGSVEAATVCGRAATWCRCGR